MTNVAYAIILAACALMFILARQNTSAWQNGMRGQHTMRVP